jgi:hypothetical protein
VPALFKAETCNWVLAAPLQDVDSSLQLTLLSTGPQDPNATARKKNPKKFALNIHTPIDPGKNHIDR